jgi:hypothetical protein
VNAWTGSATTFRPCWTGSKRCERQQLDTAFSAGFAALPRLAGLASSCGEADRLWVLLAAGAITACALSGDDVFEVFSALFADLHRWTDECLRQTGDARRAAVQWP